MGRRQPVAGKLLVNPREEHLNARFTMRQSMELFVSAGELSDSDLFFNGVERLDLRQRFGNAGGIRSFGFKEATTRMRPTDPARLQRTSG